MHIIIINYNSFQRYDTPESLMQSYFPLIGGAKGLVAAGCEVTVFQRFRENRLIHKNGIPFHFVADHGPDTTPYQVPYPLHRQVVDLCNKQLRSGKQTVVHLNGLLYPLQTRWLRGQLPPGCPIVLQHHGSRPWASGFRRSVQRWGLRGVDGFLFAAAGLAEEWIEAGIIPKMALVHEVMETSAVLNYEERPSARAKTGLTGNPIVFWAGNLDQNKDPLTILSAFAMLLQTHPEARLYMAYRHTPLLEEVHRYLAQTPSLGGAVTLLGRIPHEQMADYFNSADLFVQGSTKEGSGIALLECLACGVVPVVTDIPAFQAITGNGQVGALWPIGDAAALVSALRELLARPLPAQSRAARDFFRENWSFEAIGRRTLSVYRTIAGQHSTERMD